MKYFLFASLFASACMGTATYSGSATVTTTGGGEVYTPDLVDAEPGVQVVADYDEPVFFSEQFYWRQQNGRWYRSAYFDHGWTEAQAPAAIVRIHEPDRYRHYKPAGYTPPPRNVRDHRSPSPPPPATRDHRDGHDDHDRDHRDHHGDHDHDDHH